MYLIVLSLFLNIAFLQCDDLLESECGFNINCEWIDSIETQYCGSYNQEECLEQQHCWWYAGGLYLGSYCNGSYQVDNSYCTESEISQCQEYEFQCNDGTCICLNSNCLNNSDSVLCDGVFDCSDQSDEIDCSECSWINELACSNNVNCNWIEDIESGNCNWLSTSECVDNPQCVLDCVTSYDCFGCTGGWYEIDNGYCEDLTFIAGDANEDGYLNVSDVVLIVVTILSSQYDQYSDINQDGYLNITDIIELVNIILENN